MILCRSNRQVRELNACGLDATTIHQAKGLEYDNVVVIDFAVDCHEELNVAYVGMTRAKDRLMIVSFENLLIALKTNLKRASLL